MGVYARVCGVVYAVIFIAAPVGEVWATGQLVVDGNAAATAAKVAASQQLWRAGYSAETLTIVCDVAIAWLLYVLLRPVNRNLALLGAFFRLTYVAAYIPAVLANVVLLPLAQQHLVKGVDFAIHIHNQAFAFSLIFFGINLAIVGYLIGRAPIDVRWLSIVLEVAGACYIINTTGILLYPPLHDAIFPWILLPSFAGEVSLTLWLLFTKRFNGLQLEGAAAGYLT